MAEVFWYALRVQGGKEEKIKANIESLFEQQPFKACLERMYIPFQRAYRFSKGKREVKKSYFGYLLVQIDISNEKVKNFLMGIEGVIGFVAPGGFSKVEKPIALSQSEITRMFEDLESSDKTVQSLDDAVKNGDQVEIVAGAFQGNRAVVQKADKHSKKIEVLVRIFQKDTKLELNANQVKKI